MDPVTLAGSAVALVAPYLVEGGTELAKKVGDEVGEPDREAVRQAQGEARGVGAAKDAGRLRAGSRGCRTARRRCAGAAEEGAGGRSGVPGGAGKAGRGDPGARAATRSPS